MGIVKDLDRLALYRYASMISELSPIPYGSVKHLVDRCPSTKDTFEEMIWKTPKEIENIKTAPNVKPLLRKLS